MDSEGCTPVIEGSMLALPNSQRGTFLQSFCQISLGRMYCRAGQSPLGQLCCYCSCQCTACAVCVAGMYAGRSQLLHGFPIIEDVHCVIISCNHHLKALQDLCITHRPVTLFDSHKHQRHPKDLCYCCSSDNLGLKDDDHPDIHLLSQNTQAALQCPDTLS